MNRTEIRAALSLAAVYVLRMLGLFMVMPVLAILAVEYADYSVLMLGLAIGGYGLTQALLQIPMGILSDKIGRKPVIVGGLVIFAIGSAVAAMSDSMFYLVIGRFLQGAGAIAGAIMALAGDVSRENQRSKVMAIIGVAIGFSFYLALLLGPLIANYFGISGIFAITGVLAILCIPLIIWLVPSASNYAPKGETLPVLVDVKSLFSDPTLRQLNISVLLLHMMITLFFVQVPKLLTSFGWQLDSHWKLYLPILVTSIVGMILLMIAVKKTSQIRVIKFSIGLLLIVFAGMFLDIDSLLLLLLLSCLFFTAFNFLEANFPAMVSSIAPAGKKGSAMGIYASFQFFGAFLGGLLSGLTSQYLGSSWVFMLAAIICLLWLIMLQGLNGIQSLKRYTLAVNLQAQSVEQVGQRLAGIQGVIDITIVPDEETVYLKVNSDQFNLQQAKKALNIE